MMASDMSIIQENTRVMAPRLVPEIQLHLADEDRALYRAGEDELDALGVGTPYWAFAWAGGQALARYILDNPKSVAGRRVLDFGAGSGLVAIAAAMANAFDVIAADIDPVAAQAMELNRSLNDVWFEIEMEDAKGRSVLFGDPGRFYLNGMGLEPLASYHAETTGIMEDSDLRNARVWRFAD